MSDSVRPHRRQPTRLPLGFSLPGILQARTLEWVAISFSDAWKWKVKGKSLSCVQLFATPWTTAYQAPPSMGFSRQECWSGLPLPSPLVLGWALNPVTGVITRREDTQRVPGWQCEDWGRDYRVLQVEQCSGPHDHQKPEEARKHPFLEPSQVAGLQHLDFGLLWLGDTFLLFKPPSLWHIVVAALGAQAEEKGSWVLVSSTCHLSRQRGLIFY